MRSPKSFARRRNACPPTSATLPSVTWIVNVSSRSCMTRTRCARSCGSLRAGGRGVSSRRTSSGCSKRERERERDAQGPERLEVAVDLVVLVDEDDAVGLGVGPPFVEPARRVAPVPPAVLVDGVLERLALLVHLAVPVLLGALDEGEDRVRLGRLGEGREGRDDHVAVGLEAVRRLEVLVGEAHVLVLDRRWRWRHVAQVVAAVVPVDVVEEALEPFGELVGEGDAGLAERAVRARAVVVGEDEEDDEGGEEERPDDSGPLPQGDACSCSCAAAAAAWPPRVPPGRADHGRVGLDIVREGRRRRGAHGGCALAGTTTRARGQVERVVLLGRRRRVGRRERGRGGSRAGRGGRCAWWCGGRGRGEGERARRRLGRVVVRGGRAGRRGRVQRGRGPRVRRGQDRSQLGQCAGGWHGQVLGLDEEEEEEAEELHLEVETRSHACLARELVSPFPSRSLAQVLHRRRGTVESTKHYATR